MFLVVPFHLIDHTTPVNSVKLLDFLHSVYCVGGTRDPGILQVGPRDPKMSRWDPGPLKWDLDSDPKIFKWNLGLPFSIVLIVYSTLKIL